MTLLTDFPAGVIKVIPIALHQWVERIVGPLIIILALIDSGHSLLDSDFIGAVGSAPVSGGVTG